MKPRYYRLDILSYVLLMLVAFLTSPLFSKIHMLSAYKGRHYQNTEGELKFYLIGSNNSIFPSFYFSSMSSLMEPKLLFTDKDIASFNWKTQTIIFNDEFLRMHNVNHLTAEDYRRYQTKGGSFLLNARYNQGFTIKYRGQSIYSGSFMQAKGSSFTTTKVAYIEDIEGFSGIQIHFGYLPLTLTNPLDEVFVMEPRNTTTPNSFPPEASPSPTPDPSNEKDPDDPRYQDQRIKNYLIIRNLLIEK